MPTAASSDLGQCLAVLLAALNAASKLKSSSCFLNRSFFLVLICNLLVLFLCFYREVVLEQVKGEIIFSYTKLLSFHWCPRFNSGMSRRVSKCDLGQKDYISSFIVK